MKIKVATGAFGIPSFSIKGLPENGSSPKPDECRQDSYFIKETSKELSLGVADGVSGYDYSSKFSRALMRHSSDLIATEIDFVDAGDVIRHAFFRTAQEYLFEEKIMSGGSTATVAIIDKKSKKVRYGNLGDSSFILLSFDRAEEKYFISHKSKIGQQEFNFPFQYAILGNGSLVDYGSNIESESYIDIKKGDIILLMTDGVLDNLYEAELLDIVDETMKISKNDARGLAEAIVRKSYEFSIDKSRQCPFGDQYFVEKKRKWEGGKTDDITVVAAII